MKKFFYEDIKNIMENMKKDHVSESTAQCAYYTILSFIPFVILLLTMVQYTGIDKQTLYDAIAKIIPASMGEMVLGIVQEVYSKSLGTISISIIFTLWSAGRGMYALTRGLQSVYGATKKIETNYFYLRVKAIMQTIIFIMTIAVLLVGLVFSNSLINMFREKFGMLENFGVFHSIATEFTLIFITFIAFIIIYKLMAKKQPIKSQILGAIFGAIALNIVSFVFSIYLDIFRGFSITYGSLTTLMLIMMWTYACFYTVFLGAEINKAISCQKRKNIV